MTLCYRVSKQRRVQHAFVAFVALYSLALSANQTRVTLTPGGFFAGEGVWRSRNEQTDIASTFSGIPMKFSPLAHMNELRFSARQTRLSLLVDGKYCSTLLSGYAEIDFLGNGTANSSESNSFHPRIRNLYAAVDEKATGWHVLAGQNWSLVTMNSQGITPRNESLPPTIDAQYVVGFVWKRQPQFRLTKDFCEKVWAALSIENPQTTFGGIPSVGFGNVATITYSAVGTQTLPSTTVFSLNHVPDVIAKLAVESTIMKQPLHVECFGLYRSFYDSVQYTNNLNDNKNTSGGGVGAGVAIDMLKRLTLRGNILIGQGIGSYASGQLPDATVNIGGALVGIPEVVYMLGATLHATDALSLYLFGGAETEQAKYFEIGNTFFGYGIPTANNANCDSENAASIGCTGATRKLWQITSGFWNTLCQGEAGKLNVGLQYSYTKKELFSGTNNGTTQPVGGNTDENMVLASMRYYPFNR